MKPIRLDVGDIGEEVTRLHENLKKNGFEISHEEVKRKFFGPSTRAAVQACQKKHGLSVTGCVDEQTAAKLMTGGKAEPTTPIKPKITESKVIPKVGPTAGITGTPTPKPSDSGTTRVPPKSTPPGKPGIEEQPPLSSPKSEQPKKVVFRPDIFRLTPKDREKLNEPEKELINRKLDSRFKERLIGRVVSASEPLKATIHKLTIDHREFSGKTMDDVLKLHVFPELKKDEGLAKEVEALENKPPAGTSEKVDDALYLNTPLIKNPLLSDELRVSRTSEYARISKLGAGVADKLIQKSMILEDASEFEWDNLVKEGILTNNQKDDLIFAVDLGKLTNDNFTFMERLKTSDRKSVRDLVSLSKLDWLKMLEDEKIDPPPGETREDYAGNIAHNIDKTFPSQVLLHRLTRIDVRKVTDSLDEVAPLFAENERLIHRGKVSVTNWDKIAPAHRDKVGETLNNLVNLANTYRYLGIAGVVNDKGINLSQKKGVITTRIKHLDTFNKNNPDIDLRMVNFFDKKNGKLNWKDIPSADQPLVRKQLMAYQRTLNLADTVEDRQALLKNGNDSAITIAGKTKADFLNNSGLDYGTAQGIYGRASTGAITVSHGVQVFGEVARGIQTNVFGTSPQLINDLREIDGFDDMFGPQDYCDCAHCKSILGPAAYFVDLMYFIEQHVSKPVFTDPNIVPGRGDHPLYLKRRRPDLWTLKLTCENTNTLVPYLTIVNEVLEAYLEHNNIIQGGDIFRTLSKQTSSNEKISFHLPFNLPLEEIRIYLKHFGIALYDVYRIFKQPDEKIWRERLNLSAEEFFNITTDTDTLGIHPGVMYRFGNPSSLDDFPVNDYKDNTAGVDRRGFINIAGISRQQLGDLLAISFYPDLKNITVGNMPVPDELQNFPEILNGLTLLRLDFIHRFIRLWRKTPWSIPELDLVLTALKAPPLNISDLNGEKPNDAVLYLAQLVDIQEKLKLTVEELCAMFHYLPVSENFPEPPAKEKDKKLFERLFDVKKLFGEDPVTKKIKSSTTFHHYSLDRRKPPDTTIDPKTPILLGGLGISETELLLLCDLLKNEIPFNDDGDSIDPDNHTPIFDLRRISLLYRHARLARALKLSVEDFIQSLYLIFPPPSSVTIIPPTVTTLQQIHQLIRFRDWLKSSPFTVSELRLILKGEESSTIKYKTMLDTVVTIIQETQKYQVIDKTTREGIGKIVQEIQKSQDKVEALKDSLSRLFNLAADQLSEVLKVVTNINDPGIQTALNATFTYGVPDNPADLNDLFNMVNEIERIVTIGKIVLDVRNSQETDKVKALKGSLSRLFGLTADHLNEILNKVQTNITSPGIQTALNARFIKGIPVNPADLDTLSALVKEIEWIERIGILKNFLAKHFNITTSQLIDTLKWVKTNINGAVIYTVLYARFVVPPDFSVGEFISTLTIAGLCTVINADSYGVYLQAPINTLSWLNELLRIPDFYGILHPKKPDKGFSTTVMDLVNETNNYRGKNYADLDNDQQNTIKRLNRFLLEETYPEETPKSTFSNGVFVNPAVLSPLLTVMHEMERVLLVFSNLKFKEETIAYLTDNPATIGIADLKKLSLDNVKALTFYKKLITLGEEAEAMVQTVMDHYLTRKDFDNDMVTLADLWQQDKSLIASLTKTLTLDPAPIRALEYLWECLNLCQTLGINGFSLQDLAKATTYGELIRASEVALGAFSSKYEDEKVRWEKLEPYLDRINVKKRDALCDYIIAREKDLKFKDMGDIYAFFLLDVEMSGCFRTSRVVCAISSLQLYAHRILMNLEQSASSNLSVLTWMKAIDEIKGEQRLETFKQEWEEWRKNYRVWEANRKVFLYPENYIEPDLRDNKSHIFKELEDELLQQKITKESAESAYKKYLSQFVELTRLRYAGAYYHRIPGLDGNDSEESKYYLFARTNVQPFQYYYRTYKRHKDTRGIYQDIWGNWEKIELSIEAEEVSSLIHRERLYLFWTEVRRKEINNIKGGSSQPGGVIFKVFVKYSFINEYGKWIAPQRIYVGYTHSGERYVYERVIRRNPTEEERDKMHDYLFEQFEKYVFRKPYALIANDTRTPINLYYIWSQAQGVPNIKYYTTETITVRENRLSITLPSTTFEVVDDKFNVSKNVWVTWEWFDGARTHEGKADVTVTLLSASEADVTGAVTYDENLKPRDLKRKIYSFLQSAPPAFIKASFYNVSLSKNEITNDSMGLDITQHNCLEINNTDVSFLNKEYLVISGLLSSSASSNIVYETGDFMHYVEDGTSSFTNSGRILKQSTSGKGYLWFLNPDGRSFVDLTTILTDELSEILFATDIEQFLSLETQKITDGVNGLNFDGPYGVYYQELFFHIPCLIAHHLNANQKFKEAKWWYERIFDPTSSEPPPLPPLYPTDRNWRYTEFRGKTPKKMRDILTDKDAIEKYKQDPFSPHAIARLRLNAYQKTIVMKYIDNLLDWGDYLFGQDTMESINEATMLYVLAADILGKRPVKLGPCKTAKDAILTYEKIGPAIGEEPEPGKKSEFLITLENWVEINKVEMQPWNKYAVLLNTTSGATNTTPASTTGGTTADSKTKTLTGKFTPVGNMITKEAKPRYRVTPYTHVAEEKRRSKALVKTANVKYTAPVTNLMATGTPVTFETSDTNVLVGTSVGLDTAASTAPDTTGTVVGLDTVVSVAPDIADIGVTRAEIGPGILESVKPGTFRTYPGNQFVQEIAMAFCIPHNEEFLKYWDRVEDRLFKIRNCMNISGVRRQLALFQPPINPMLLVRAKAAGLSLEDILGMLAAQLPPYRFSYLIEKAKQFTQTVQSFGSTLLSALEKKDVEELTLLRSVHERNILRMTKEIKKQQLKEAQYQYQAMVETETNVQNRIDYYEGLIDAGLTGWEVIQQVSKHAGTILLIAETALRLSAGISHLLPQAGSPFAMTYGGQQIGDSQLSFSEFIANLSRISDAISASAGLEATFQRP